MGGKRAGAGAGSRETKGASSRDLRAPSGDRAGTVEEEVCGASTGSYPVFIQDFGISLIMDFLVFILILKNIAQ